MVIATSNIAFSAIQTEFGGVNPINISEYYSNASTYYTSNISSLPVINNIISISMFSDLAKDINILYRTAGTYTYTVPLTPIFSGTIAGGAHGGGGAGNRISINPNLNRSGGRGAVRIMALGKNSNISFPTNAK